MANIELKEAEAITTNIIDELFALDIKALDILADVSKAVLRLRMERGECLDERTSVDSVDLPGR